MGSRGPRCSPWCRRARPDHLTLHQIDRLQEAPRRLDVRRAERNEPRVHDLCIGQPVLRGYCEHRPRLRLT